MIPPSAPRINSLPDGYRTGVHVEDSLDDEEGPDTVYFYVLYHWERPRGRMRKRWVKKAQVKVGPHRNLSIEAAIRGVWLRNLDLLNWTFPPAEEFRR